MGFVAISIIDRDLLCDPISIRYDLLASADTTD